MEIGVTGCPPDEWEDWGVTENWCFETEYGGVYCKIDKAWECEGWRTNKSGGKRRIDDGDEFSVTMCADGSISITYNETEFTHMFTKFTDKPQWVIIRPYVKRLVVT